MSEIIELFNTKVFKPYNLDEINRAIRLGINKGYELNISKLISNFDLLNRMLDNFNSYVGKLELTFNGVVCSSNPFDIYIATIISNLNSVPLTVIKTKEERDLLENVNLIDGKINIDNNYLIVCSILDYAVVNYLKTNIVNKGGDIENVVSLFNLCEGDDEIIKTKYNLSVGSYITLKNIIDVLLNKNMIDNFIMEKIYHISEIAVKEKIINEKKTNTEQINKFSNEDREKLFYDRYLSMYMNNIQVFNMDNHDSVDDLKECLISKSIIKENNENLVELKNKIKKLHNIDLVREYKTHNNLIINLCDKSNFNEVFNYIKIMDNKLSYIVNFDNMNIKLNEFVSFFDYVNKNHITLIYNYKFNNISSFENNDLISINNIKDNNLFNNINNINSFSNLGNMEFRKIYDLSNSSNINLEKDLREYNFQLNITKHILNNINNIILQININSINDIKNLDSYIENLTVNNANIFLKLCFNVNTIKKVFKDEQLWTLFYGIIKIENKLNIRGIIINYEDLFKNEVSIPKKVKLFNICPLILNIGDLYKIDESLVNNTKKTEIFKEYIEREELLISYLKKNQFSHIIYNDNILVRTENNTVKYTNETINKYFNNLFTANKLNTFSLNSNIIELYNKYKLSFNKQLLTNFTNNYYTKELNNIIKPYHKDKLELKNLTKIYEEKLKNLNENKILVLKTINGLFNIKESKKPSETSVNYSKLLSKITFNINNIHKIKNDIYVSVNELINNNEVSEYNNIWNYGYGIGTLTTFGYNLFISPIKYLLNKN